MKTDWKTWEPNMRATLMFVVDEPADRVLLIRKKRGLGAGKVNGPGGKIDPGETAEACAVRETEEELGVSALNPLKFGELWFAFTDGLQLHVEVFMATQWRGEAHETNEAIPLWTAIEEIPFDEMWRDDRYWLKQMLRDKSVFTGRFDFDADAMLSDSMEWNSEGWIGGVLANRSKPI